MTSFIRLGFAGALLVATPATAIAQDLAKGETLFRRCAVCHGIGDTNKPVGPSLNNVIGRTAGTEESYATKYSRAMIAAGEAGLVWTVEEISEYITDPRKKIPGNKMAFPGLRNESDRTDVIAYLAQFSPEAAAEADEEEAAEPAEASQ